MSVLEEESPLGKIPICAARNDSERSLDTRGSNGAAAEGAGNGWELCAK